MDHVGIESAPPSPSDNQVITNQLETSGVVRVGNRQLRYGTNLLTMRDSTEEYKQGKYNIIRERLKKEGYIFIKNIINTEQIRASCTIDRRRSYCSLSVDAGSFNFYLGLEPLTLSLLLLYVSTKRKSKLKASTHSKL
jgi:hypothetical protein